MRLGWPFRRRDTELATWNAAAEQRRVAKEAAQARYAPEYAKALDEHRRLVKEAERARYADGTEVSPSWLIEQANERLRKAEGTVRRLERDKLQLSAQLRKAEETIRSQANRIRFLRDIRDAPIPGQSVGEREDAKRQSGGDGN